MFIYYFPQASNNCSLDLMEVGFLIHMTGIYTLLQGKRIERLMYWEPLSFRIWYNVKKKTIKLNSVQINLQTFTYYR